MRVFTTTQFKGHWPVGSAAVIVAEDRVEAERLLAAQLTDRGLVLNFDGEADPFIELDVTVAHAMVLCDGNY